jgi:hypothetical protein
VKPRTADREVEADESTPDAQLTAELNVLRSDWQQLISLQEVAYAETVAKIAEDDKAFAGFAEAFALRTRQSEQSCTQRLAEIAQELSKVRTQRSQVTGAKTSLLSQRARELSQSRTDLEETRVRTIEAATSAQEQVRKNATQTCGFARTRVLELERRGLQRRAKQLDAGAGKQQSDAVAKGRQQMRELEAEFNAIVSAAAAAGEPVGAVTEDAGIVSAVDVTLPKRPPASQERARTAVAAAAERVSARRRAA